MSGPKMVNKAKVNQGATLLHFCNMIFLMTLQDKFLLIPFSISAVKLINYQIFFFELNCRKLKYLCESIKMVTIEIHLKSSKTILLPNAVYLKKNYKPTEKVKND